MPPRTPVSFWVSERRCFGAFLFLRCSIHRPFAHFLVGAMSILTRWLPTRRSRPWPASFF
eukprot:7618474-Lingulodinium_polyedra.AAC.1